MSLQDRTKYLSRLSGLPVTLAHQKGISTWTFGWPSHVLKTVWTYRKAKVFAEGIAIGRKL